ncbi:MAG TPA: hypothetical protein VJX67_26295 [Blastocatellia bacterium]|nr:hypothetical protein [Blastocatellia bacterium]
MMSKSLRRYQDDMEKRILRSREAVKLLLREYGDLVRLPELDHEALTVKQRKQREVQLAVGEYMGLCKALEQFERQVKRPR